MSRRPPPQDALQQYKARRDFSRTPEPAEGGAARAGRLSFVVQKHWASRLHYDFRLELDGTMMSWAVPKGPSLDPKHKRMAVHVEDHPISYAGFEGTIPAGQYGAGKVIVWDTGWWQPLGDAQRGLRDGNLKFELHGHKLQGHWVLVRMKGNGEKQEPWLLIKEADDFARPAASYSVVDEMPDSVKARAAPRQTTASSKTSSRARAMSAAPRASLPAKLAPQLATLVERPPQDAGAWLYEIKFDGYRLLSRVEGKAVQLFTRNGNDWTDRLSTLHETLVKMKLPPGWYDGEIVVMNEAGLPDFGALQLAFDAASSAEIVYYVFDLPYCDGLDLRQQPLQVRRARLQQVLQASPAASVRFSEVFDAAAHDVVASACRLGLEGIVGKRVDSPYVSRRSADWIKLKCSRRQEFVIAGYTDPRGARNGLGALLLAVHDKDGALQYAGDVGTGFNDSTLGDLAARLKKLQTSKSPFGSATKVAGAPHWVKPQLVAEVSFGEWTRGGRIRHAVFQGLRADKPAAEIRREKAEPVARAARAAGAARSAPARPSGAAEAPGASASETPQPLSQRLRVTHGERVVDAASGATKLDVVRYYALVGKLMLPHLKHRPVALVRAPAGIGGQLFFQKHAETERLPGIVQLDPGLYPGHPPMLAVASAQGLLSAAQWNVIEFHTVNAVSEAFEHPDRMVFDLDPGEGVAWPQVQEAATLMRGFMQELGLAPFLKTSGGKGLHVVVPLRKQHDWDTVKGFSQAVVAHLAQTLPKRFVARSGPRNRVGRIFIDYLRNGQGATTASAWSARARPGLGISVPVDWSEIDTLRGGDHWTVASAHTRLDSGNAPWKGYARSARSLTAAMKTLGWKPPGRG